MGFVRCPYSNAVLKVWGKAVQRTWTEPPLITEDILQSKRRRRIVKEVWVGCEDVARLTVRTSRRVDCQQRSQFLEASASTSCVIDGSPFAFRPWRTDIPGDASQMVRDEVIRIGGNGIAVIANK